MKFYYTYKIVLLKGSLAGKYYYGQHSTDDIRDHYAGSGKILQKYYKKYRAVEGVTYTKEILKFYNGPEELNQAENILIGDLWKTDPNCLNLKKGGNNIYDRTPIKDCLRRAQKCHPVIMYSLDGRILREFESLHQAADWIGKPCRKEIKRVCENKHTQCQGFKWKYKWLEN